MRVWQFARLGTLPALNHRVNSLYTCLFHQFLFSLLSFACWNCVELCKWAWSAGEIQSCLCGKKTGPRHPLFFLVLNVAVCDYVGREMELQDIWAGFGEKNGGNTKFAQRERDIEKRAVITEVKTKMRAGYWVKEVKKVGGRVRPGELQLSTIQPRDKGGHALACFLSTYSHLCSQSLKSLTNPALFSTVFRHPLSNSVLSFDI